MVSNPCKLLVVDIDGTLLDGNGNISTGDREALAKARDLGIRVSLSTGRAANACLSVINRLSLDGYHIFFDGALVSNPHSGEEFYVKPISKTALKQMIEASHQLDLDLELHSATRYFAERESWSTAIRRQFFGIEPVITDFNQLWERERIVKGGLLTSNPREAALTEDFRRRLGNRIGFSHARTPAYPNLDFINLLAPGATDRVDLGWHDAAGPRCLRPGSPPTATAVDDPLGTMFGRRAR